MGLVALLLPVYSGNKHRILIRFNYGMSFKRFRSRSLPCCPICNSDPVSCACTRLRLTCLQTKNAAVVARRTQTRCAQAETALTMRRTLSTVSGEEVSLVLDAVKQNVLTIA